MFDDSAAVLWVRNLEGTVNDLHPIKVSLGFDGTAYKGILTVLDAQASFDLSGAMEDDVLVLQEIDSKGLHTGYLIGALEDDRFTAQWWSTDMSRSTSLRLMESGLILLKDFNPHMAVLEGMAGVEVFDCILIVESTGVISGTWQRKNECVRLLGHCEDQLCNKIVLVVAEGELSGTHILLENENAEAYRVSIENESTPQHGTARVLDVISLRRHAQADYSFIIDFTYPDIEEGNFNSWVEAKFLDWYNASLSTLAKIDETGPENRWSLTASGWLDVFLYTDQLISGLITYYDPGKKKYEREYFIYSTREARELKLAELGKKDRDLLIELQRNIHVDGIDSNEFKYPVLTKSGFFVCTEFDAIEGDFSAMVSYDSVEKAIKRKTFLAKLED
jgi:hypothetical protein